MKTGTRNLRSAGRLQIIAVIFLFVFGTASIKAQFATARPSYSVNAILKGPCGEAVSDVIFKDMGWTKLSIKPLNPLQGLDGVYPYAY
jgi:hypothetical protein